MVDFLVHLLKIELPLIKNVIKSLAKSVSIPLGQTTAASAADSGIHKKTLGSGRCHSSSHVLRIPSSDPKTTTLIIPNDEIKDIIEIVTSLEDSSLLLKGVSKTIENESKEQKEELLSMLLGTSGARLLGNILARKGVNRAEEGIVRAGYGNKKVRKTTKKNKLNF